MTIRARLGRSPVPLVAAAIAIGVAACVPTAPVDTTPSGRPEPSPASGEPATTAGDPSAPPRPPTPVASGAPDWVVPGTRLTFYTAAASIATSRYQLVEDPSCADVATPPPGAVPGPGSGTSGIGGGDPAGPPAQPGATDDPSIRPDQHGCYYDRATGTWYRKTDEGPQAQSPTTASGDGLTQTDVIAFDGGTVVLSNDVYLFDRTFNQFVMMPAGGTRSPGSVVDGVWMHPAELARIDARGLPGRTVLRGRYELGGTAYDAVLFWSESQSGHTSYTYDARSGVLLASNTSTGGGSGPVRVGGDAPPTGNTQLTMARLVGVRQRTLPGVDGRNPDWVASTRELRYAGSLTWVNPIDPSTGQASFPLEHTVAVGPGGADWAPTTVRTVIPGLASDETVEGMSGPTGLYWYDPAALRSMSSGQILDEDPTTGERVVAADHGQAAGGPALTIDGRLPGVHWRATYDLASGVLLGYELHQASQGMTISLRLQERR